MQIRFSAREVVAAGRSFVPWGEVMSDADVALDEISTLRPTSEPLVLRVEAEGGAAGDASRVWGDWLCEADGSPPRRLPTPEWSYSEDAAFWGRAHTWTDAWEECEDARWMLHAASAVGVDRRPLVLAACACSRLAISRVPSWEPRPLRALEATEAWVRDVGSRATASRAAREAEAAWVLRADDPGSLRAIESVVHAFDCALAYPGAERSLHAAAAAHAAAEAIAFDVAGQLRKMSMIVQGALPTFAVLRAAIAADVENRSRDSSR